MTRENYVEAICDVCGESFERFYCHPYITKCKKCRKSKSAGMRVDDNTRGRSAIKSQYLPEWGIRIKACCIDKMKTAIDKGYRGKICCTCNNQIRILSDDMVGIGYGLYRIDGDAVVLVRNYSNNVRRR